MTSLSPLGEEEEEEDDTMREPARPRSPKLSGGRQASPFGLLPLEEERGDPAEAFRMMARTRTAKRAVTFEKPPRIGETDAMLESPRDVPRGPDAHAETLSPPMTSPALGELDETKAEEPYYPNFPKKSMEGRRLRQKKGPRQDRKANEDDAKRKKKFSSTATMFIGSTISAPKVCLLFFCSHPSLHHRVPSLRFRRRCSPFFRYPPPFRITR
jgi:hypothetical protein